MADEQITVTTQLFLGRGLLGEPVGDEAEQLELAVDLYDLGVDYPADWLAWAGVNLNAGDPAAATQAWMPLADSDGLLVLDSDGNLIPTLITL